MTEQLQRTVASLAEPLAAGADLDLVEVQVKGGGGRRLVRVVVDRKGGVDLARCQALSQQLSARLDEVDPFPERYSLEVTSPGIDHPLLDRRDFDRVEGRTVLVHRDTEEGVRELRGTVTEAQEAGVVLESPDGRVEIPYAEIVKARQTLPW